MRAFDPNHLRPSALLLGCLFALGASACAGKTAVPEQPPVSIPTVASAPAPSFATAPAATPTVLPSPRRTFLFALKHPNTPQKTLYLFGSVHAAKDDFYPLCQTIENAYKQSDALVVEVNLSNLTDSQQLRTILARAALPPAQTLQTHLSPAAWNRLTVYAQESGLPMKVFAPFKPWFAALTIIGIKIAQAGYAASLGLDRHFMDRHDKPIFELETADYQLSIYDNLTDPLAELLLLDSMDGTLQGVNVLTEMMDAWRAGDVAALTNVLFRDVDARPELKPLYDAVYVQRNRQMAKKLFQLLENKDTLFVVVGAGHLVGANGLLEIFENEGYTYSQLKKE